MPRVFVSLGSNVDRDRNLCAALVALGERFGEVTASPVYESAAQGFDGAPFYNLVVAFDSEESLAAVLAGLRGIERAGGRARGGPRFASRTLDLDLLLYGELAGEPDGVRLPRVDILRHAFVLRPLADIAPAGRHPLDGRTYAQLWEDFAGPRALRRVVLDADPG